MSAQGALEHILNKSRHQLMSMHQNQQYQHNGGNNNGYGDETTDVSVSSTTRRRHRRSRSSGDNSSKKKRKNNNSDGGKGYDEEEKGVIIADSTRGQQKRRRRQQMGQRAVDENEDEDEATRHARVVQVVQQERLRNKEVVAGDQRAFQKQWHDVSNHDVAGKFINVQTMSPLITIDDQTIRDGDPIMWEAYDQDDDVKLNRFQQECRGGPNDYSAWTATGEEVQERGGGGGDDNDDDGNVWE